MTTSPPAQPLPVAGPPSSTPGVRVPRDWGDALVRSPAAREFSYWWHRYRRTWRGTVVISVANPLLFVAALGFGLGHLVDQRATASLDGRPYLNFIAPGLLAASAMQTAFLETAGNVFQSSRPRGNYRAAITTPMTPADILTGHLLWVAARIALASAAIIVVITAFGAVPPARTGLLLVYAVLTGLAFATPVSAYATTANRPAKLTSIFRFVILPLYMFSGTFFPAEQLPAWLHPLLWISPLWHGSELCRFTGHAWLHLLVLTAVIVAGYAAGRRTYARSLTA
jgi:lipooligosaccharide transport system permease protein